MTPQDIIATARTWLGVPFLHQGRTRQGVDCGGLLVAIGEEAGAAIVHPAVYSQSPDPAILLEALAANCHKVPVSQYAPGDVLLMSFAGEPRHVGLATDAGLLHAWAKPGKVVEHRMDSVWERRIRSAWRPNLYGVAA